MANGLKRVFPLGAGEQLLPIPLHSLDLIDSQAPKSIHWCPFKVQCADKTTSGNLSPNC
jgi:hypothetical protein